MLYHAIGEATTTAINTSLMVSLLSIKTICAVPIPSTFLMPISLVRRRAVRIDTVAFNFDEQESQGTQKLLYLLGPWFDALQNGKVLVVDELDCSSFQNWPI
jgi:hypothetical protein